MENIEILQTYKSDNEKTKLALAKLRGITKNFTVIPDEIKTDVQELILLVERDNVQSTNNNVQLTENKAWQMTQQEWNKSDEIEAKNQTEITPYGSLILDEKKQVWTAEKGFDKNDNLYFRNINDKKEPISKWFYLKKTGRKLLKKDEHRQLVKNAIAKGKDVPQKVLNEYPELLNNNKTQNKMENENILDIDIEKNINLDDLEKLPAKQFHQSNDYIYYDKNTGKYYFKASMDGSVAEIRNLQYLAEINKVYARLNNDSCSITPNQFKNDNGKDIITNGSELRIFTIPHEVKNISTKYITFDKIEGNLKTELKYTFQQLKKRFKDGDLKFDGYTTKDVILFNAMLDHIHKCELETETENLILESRKQKIAAEEKAQKALKKSEQTEKELEQLKKEFAEKERKELEKIQTKAFFNDMGSRITAIEKTYSPATKLINKYKDRKLAKHTNVSVSLAKAIEEVLDLDKFYKLNKKDAETIFDIYKNKKDNLIYKYHNDQYIGDGSEENKYFEKIEKLIDEDYLKFDTLDLLDEILGDTSPSSFLTEHSIDFCKAIENRLETRKLAKQGSDLFPETANIEGYKAKGGAIKKKYRTFDGNIYTLYKNVATKKLATKLAQKLVADGTADYFRTSKMKKGINIYTLKN